MRIIFAAILSILVVTQPAAAYIDPGTGSLIVQGIIAAVSAIVAAGYVGWDKLKSMFGGQKPNQESGDKKTQSDKDE